MTPTTTQRAVLKIHMALDARLTGGLPRTPSVHHKNQRLVNWRVRGLITEWAAINRSQLVDVKVWFMDRFCMMHDTLESLEMLTIRWLVTL